MFWKLLATTLLLTPHLWAQLNVSPPPTQVQGPVPVSVYSGLDLMPSGKSAQSAIFVRLSGPVPPLTTGTNIIGAVGFLGNTLVPSYSATGTVSSVASATDIAVLPGVARATIYVYRLIVTCQETTAGQVALFVIKRSTADSGGTSAAMSNGPDDSGYPADSALPLTYTANPTLGTASSTVDTAYITCIASTTATPSDIYILDRTMKPIVLHGTNEQLAVNLNGITVAGGSFKIKYEYLETTAVLP